MRAVVAAVALLLTLTACAEDDYVQPPDVSDAVVSEEELGDLMACEEYDSYSDEYARCAEDH